MTQIDVFLPCDPSSRYWPLSCHSSLKVTKEPRKDGNGLPAQTPFLPVSSELSQGTSRENAWCEGAWEHSVRESMVPFLPRVFMKEDFLALRVNASGVCGRWGGGGRPGVGGGHWKCMFSLSQQLSEPWASLTFSSECSPSRDLRMTPGGIFFFFFKCCSLAVCSASRKSAPERPRKTTW